MTLSQQESEITSDIQWLIDSFGARIAAHGRDAVAHFLAFGEYAVALETLCEQIFESSAQISALEREKITSLIPRVGLVVGDFAYVLDRERPDCEQK